MAKYGNVQYDSRQLGRRGGFELGLFLVFSSLCRHNDRIRGSKGVLGVLDAWREEGWSLSNLLKKTGRGRSILPPSYDIEQAVHGSGNESETDVLIEPWLVVSLYCGPTAPKPCKRDCASSEIGKARPRCQLGLG